MAVTVSQRITQRGNPSTRYGSTAFIDLSTDSAITTADHAKTFALQRDIRTYSTQDDIDPLESRHVKDALASYFSSEAYPASAIVATQIGVVRPTVMLTKDLSADAIEALGDGVSLSFAGNSISGLDLDAKATLAAQATELARALNGDANLSGITVTVVGTAFLITAPATLNIGDGFEVAGEVATALPLNTPDLEAYAERVSAVETGTSTANRLKEDPSDPRQGVLVGTAMYTDQTGEDVLTRAKRYIDVGAGQEIITHVQIKDSDKPMVQSEGNLLYDLNQLSGNRAWISAFYTARSDHKHAAYAGVFSGINFNLVGQHLNGAGRDLPGVNADRISDELAAALDAQNCNYYLDDQGYTEVVGGTNISEWTDVVYVSSWTKRGVRNAVRDLRKSLEALTIDEIGRSRTISAMNTFFERMVRGGFVRVGGQVSSSQRDAIATLTGSNFDGVLPTGYQVWVEPASSVTDPSARDFMQVYYWVLYTGSANNVAIEGSFSQ